MMIIHRVESLCLAMFLVVGFAASGARAATINVTDAAVAGACIPGGDPCTDFDGSTCSLQDALDIAECNGESDIINVAAGFYDADAANTFSYTAADGENFSLDIIGAGTTTLIDGNDADLGMDLDTRFAGGDDAGDIFVSQIAFEDGNFSGPGGGLAVNTVDADVTVQNCSFISNFSDEWGGGLYALGTGESEMFYSTNLFLDNTANFDDGGGLYAESGQASITAVNNILAGNTSNDGSGGGMFLNASVGNITITNNTLFNNTATNGDGGGIGSQVDDSASTFNIYNNIVFGNTAGTNGDDIWTCEQGAIVNLFNNDFTEYYSEALDGGGCGGTATLNQANNIPDDPLFVNSGADDFHLQALSPAIDTGDLAAPAMPSTDFDGNPRPSGPLPDMGALEFQVIPTPTPTPVPIPTPTPTPPAVALLEGTGCQLNASAVGTGLMGSWMVWLSLGGIALVRRFRK